MKPQYTRFLHLKLIGENVEKLKEQVAAAGLDPEYLDKEFPDYRQFPQYNAIFEERKHGIDAESLKQKMR